MYYQVLKALIVRKDRGKRTMNNQDFARVGKRKVAEVLVEVLHIVLCTSISEKKFEVGEKLL